MSRDHLRPALLRRTSLFHGESCLSLLYRLASLNGCALRDLLSLLQFPHTQWKHDLSKRTEQALLFPSEDLLMRLSTLTGLPRDRLSAATAVPFAEVLCADDGLLGPVWTRDHRDYWMRWLKRPVGETWSLMPFMPPIRSCGSVQYCPLCVQEAPYHRVIWLASALTVCLKHHTLLQQGCVSCGDHLDLANLLGMQCGSCHGSLQDSPVVRFDPREPGALAHAHLLSWITRRMSPGPYRQQGKVERFPSRHPGILYSLALGLSRVMSEVSPPPLIESLATTSTEAPLLPFHLPAPTLFGYLSAAILALADWPTRFDTFLTSVGGPYLSAVIPSTEKALVQPTYRRLKHFTHFALLRQAYETFLVKHHLTMDWQIDHRVTPGSPLARARVRELCRVGAAHWEVDLETIVYLLRIGFLTLDDLCHCARYEVYLGYDAPGYIQVRHQDFEAAHQMGVASLKVADVAKWLGLSPATVAALFPTSRRLSARPSPSESVSYHAGNSLPKNAETIRKVDYVTQLRAVFAHARNQGKPLYRWLIQVQANSESLVGSERTLTPDAIAATFLQAVAQGRIEACFDGHRRSTDLSHIGPREITGFSALLLSD